MKMTHRATKSLGNFLDSPKICKALLISRDGALLSAADRKVSERARCDFSQAQTPLLTNIGGYRRATLLRKTTRV